MDNGVYGALFLGLLLSVFIICGGALAIVGLCIIGLILSFGLIFIIATKLKG